jgi:hypothetical protein
MISRHAAVKPACAGYAATCFSGDFDAATETVDRALTAIVPAIEPTPDPATLKPSSANAMTAVTLPIDEQYGLVIESVLDERMFECSFSFLRSSLASSQSICASIAAANYGMALSREKSRTSTLIF